MRPASGAEGLGDRLLGLFARDLHRPSSGRGASAPSSRTYRSMFSQSVPTLRSTSSGGSSGRAPSITSRARSARARQLLLIGLEDELVVDLQQHPRAQAALAHDRRQPHHGDLHPVGSGALDRHVDGHPLPGRAQRLVARRELRQVAPSAEQRGHEALVAGQDADLGRVAADARVRREVVGDEALGLLARDLEPIRQPEVARARRRSRS